MRLAIPYIALGLFISFEAVICASLQDTERSIVKRDVDIIPAVFSGAVDMGLDLLDRFGKGFAVLGSSKTDIDTLGLHDEKRFETGMGDAMMPQERKKRSPIPCGRRNGTTSNVNRRNATDPDVETLARRKRSAQLHDTPLNGHHPNGPPPNGPPPNGPPPNGPPPNGPPPNGPPPFNQEIANGDRTESNTLVREKRSPCRNATDVRSKRSALKPADNIPRRSDLNQDQNWEKENRNLNANGENLEQEHRTLNGYGGNSQNANYRRKKRSAKPCNGNNQTPGGNGFPTNNFPQLPQQQTQPQQFPQLPQQQQQAPNGVNIGDLQRDQNQRRRRDVNDPDSVLPNSSTDDQNLFERLVQVAKEIISRVARWANDADSKPKL